MLALLHTLKFTFESSSMLAEVSAQLVDVLLSLNADQIRVTIDLIITIVELSDHRATNPQSAFEHVWELFSCVNDNYYVINLRRAARAPLRLLQRLADLDLL